MKYIITYCVLLILALLFFVNCNYNSSQNSDVSINAPNNYLNIDVKNDSTTIHSLATIMNSKGFKNKKRDNNTIKHYNEWDEKNDVFFQKKDFLYKSKVTSYSPTVNSKLFNNPIYVWNNDSTDLIFLNRLFEKIKIRTFIERNWNTQDSDLSFEIKTFENDYLNFKKEYFISLNGICLQQLS